jgi:hypothetical protein
MHHFWQKPHILQAIIILGMLISALSFVIIGPVIESPALDHLWAPIFGMGLSGLAAALMVIPGLPDMLMQVL